MLHASLRSSPRLETLLPPRFAEGYDKSAEVPPRLRDHRISDIVCCDAGLRSRRDWLRNHCFQILHFNADSSLFAKSEESLKAWRRWRIGGFPGADAPSLGTETTAFWQQTDGLCRPHGTSGCGMGTAPARDGDRPRLGWGSPRFGGACPQWNFGFCENSGAFGKIFENENCLRKFLSCGVVTL